MSNPKVNDLFALLKPATSNYKATTSKPLKTRKKNIYEFN